ncbi:MAG: helix-turn-helix domain-containing protein [Negativicutes bacterium]|nr:helix-turn-helix domain-containing protein [Negativicutes bacterium]
MEHSFFYSSLDPIGLGTALSEGFTSWLAGLAEAHCVPVGKLIDHELAPRLGKAYLLSYAGAGGTGFYMRASHTINGRGKIAADFVDLMGQLTLRTDVELLTMRIYQEVIPDRFLLRSTRAWCPECINDMRRELPRIYEPLIWSLAPVEYCPIHLLRLQVKCPTCGKMNSALNRFHRNGYCSSCQSWLASNVTRRREPDQHKLFKVRELGQLIAAIPNLKTKPPRHSIQHSLEYAIDGLANGSRRQFCKRFGIPENTLSDWMNEKCVPSIEQCLAVIKSINVPLLDLLIGNVNIKYPSAPSLKKIETPVHKVKKINWDRLKVAIDAYKDGNMSLTAIAKKYHCDRKALCNKFPTICREIVAMFRSNLQNRTGQTAQRDSLIVETVIEEIKQTEAIPSRRRIEQTAGKPALLKGKTAKAVWKQLTTKR